MTDEHDIDGSMYLFNILFIYGEYQLQVLTGKNISSKEDYIDNIYNIDGYNAMLLSNGMINQHTTISGDSLHLSLSLVKYLQDGIEHYCMF